MWDSVDPAVRSVDARPDPRGGGRVAGAHVRAPGMLLGEEPPPLPPLPRCNALLPVYGTCAAARPGRIVDAGIYEALGKTGALEGRHR